MTEHIPNEKIRSAVSLWLVPFLLCSLLGIVVWMWQSQATIIQGIANGQVSTELQVAKIVVHQDDNMTAYNAQQVEISSLQLNQQQIVKQMTILQTELSDSSCLQGHSP